MIIWEDKNKDERTVQKSEMFNIYFSKDLDF